MIKISNLSELVVKENTLVREKQAERVRIERDVSQEKSRFLNIQYARNQMAKELERIRKLYADSLQMLDEISGKIDTARSQAREEDTVLKKNLENILQKVHEASEYLQAMRREERTLEELEELQKQASQRIQELKRQDESIQKSWTIKEKSLKARENTVKNQEIILQYEREQLEAFRMSLDGKKIALDQKSEELTQREELIRIRENETLISS